MTAGQSTTEQIQALCAACAVAAPAMRHNPPLRTLALHSSRLHLVGNAAAAHCSSHAPHATGLHTQGSNRHHSRMRRGRLQYAVGQHLSLNTQQEASTCIAQHCQTSSRHISHCKCEQYSVKCDGLKFVNTCTTCLQRWEARQTCKRALPITCLQKQSNSKPCGTLGA
jgi:hypothetical protein